MKCHFFPIVRAAFLLAVILVVGVGVTAGQGIKEVLDDHESKDIAVAGTASGMAKPGNADSAPPSDDRKWATTVLAVMSDLHLREEKLPMFRNAVAYLNASSGIDAVACLGDFVDKTGSQEEWDLVKQELSKMKKPLLSIAGNHEYLYKDEMNVDGTVDRCPPEERQAKLARFQDAVQLKSLHYTRWMGGHLLVFLSSDNLESRDRVSISEGGLAFLSQALAKHPKTPTIIFFHAPLEGSYATREDMGVPPEKAAAQPSDKIKAILARNPQAYMWVAGHQHLHPGDQDYQARVTKVDGVKGIHVANLTSNNAWIRVLRITPKKVTLRTYDVGEKHFLVRFDREFTPPRLSRPQFKGDADDRRDP